MANTRYYPTSGADGDNVSGVNTPGVDDLVRTGANSGVGDIKVETTAPSIDGTVSRSIRTSKTVTLGGNYARFDEVPVASWAGRLWMKWNSLPTGATIPFFRVLTSTDQVALNCQMLTTGKFQVTDAGGSTNIWNPTAMSAISTGLWYGLEMFSTNADTTGTFKGRFFRQNDKSVLATTVGYAGADGSGLLSGLNMAPANVARYRLGVGTAGSNAGAADVEWVFDLNPGASDFMPVWSDNLPPTGSASVDPAASQFINASGFAPAGSDSSVQVVSISPSTNTRIGINAPGQPGVWVPNTDEEYDLTVEGVPSGTSRTVTGIQVTAITGGGGTNVTAPRIVVGGNWS